MKIRAFTCAPNRSAVGRATAGLPISGTHTKNNLPAKQKGYDNSETTVEKLSPRRIQIYPDYFFLGVILKVIHFFLKFVFNELDLRS